MQEEVAMTSERREQHFDSGKLGCSRVVANVPRVLRKQVRKSNEPGRNGTVSLRAFEYKLKEWLSLEMAKVGDLSNGSGTDRDWRMTAECRTDSSMAFPPFPLDIA
jgi:hypothetical protein